jgi:O-antigen/teichoic acid export membrane protein
MISAAGLVASVVLTLGLVPVLEAQGAAIAFAAAELVVASCSFWSLHRARPELRFSLRVPSRVLLAAGLAAGVALIANVSSLATALIGCAIYLTVLVATRAIPAELAQALRGYTRAAD